MLLVKIFTLNMNQSYRRTQRLGVKGEIWNQYRYDIAVKDLYINIQFNDDAYSNLFDREEFEESIYMVLERRLSSTLSKKCKKDMPAKVVIHSGDFWYDKSRLRDDVHKIGDMDIQKANPYTHKEGN